MGVEIKLPPGIGSYWFQIHGWIYHLVSPPCPTEENKPGYGQHFK
jgi:hypothetical protein